MSSLTHNPLRSYIIEHRVYTKEQREELENERKQREEKEQRAAMRERQRQQQKAARSKKGDALLTPGQVLAALGSDDDDDDDDIVETKPEQQEQEQQKEDTTTVPEDEDETEKKQEKEEANSSVDDDKEQEQEQNTTFACYPISVKKSEICYALLDSEAKVEACLKGLIPVLKTIVGAGANFQLSWDCEWHQPAGEQFTSELTKLSLIQVGIALSPLERDSPILALVFDLLQLKDEVTSNALKQIFEMPQPEDQSSSSMPRMQLAFDCRRDAKILQRYGVKLDRIFDLQLLERAARAEAVPSTQQSTYVFRLMGLFKIMNNMFADELDYYCRMKSGINADDSEENFLKRPLSQETILYSSVDAVILFLLFVEFEKKMGRQMLEKYRSEVFESSQLNAEFEMAADDVRYNEHGILPLKIIPRLDGDRAGDVECFVCHRKVARRAGMSCIVCRKREMDLKRIEGGGASSSPSSTRTSTGYHYAGSPSSGKTSFSSYNNKNNNNNKTKPMSTSSIYEDEGAFEYRRNKNVPPPMPQIPAHVLAQLQSGGGAVIPSAPPSQHQQAPPMGAPSGFHHHQHHHYGAATSQATTLPQNSMYPQQHHHHHPHNSYQPQQHQSYQPAPSSQSSNSTTSNNNNNNNGYDPNWGMNWGQPRPPPQHQQQQVPQHHHHHHHHQNQQMNSWAPVPQAQQQQQYQYQNQYPHHHHHHNQQYNQQNYHQN